jgi:hypothetical protein
MVVYRSKKEGQSPGGRLYSAQNAFVFKSATVASVSAMLENGWNWAGGAGGFNGAGMIGVFRLIQSGMVRERSARRHVILSKVARHLSFIIHE